MSAFTFPHAVVARVPTRADNPAEDNVVCGWWILPLDKGIVHLLEVFRRLPLAIGHFSSADSVDTGTDGELFMHRTRDYILTRPIERICRDLDLTSPLLSPSEVADLDVFGLVQEDVFRSQIAVKIVKAFEPKPQRLRSP